MSAGVVWWEVSKSHMKLTSCLELAVNSESKLHSESNVRESRFTRLLQTFFLKQFLLAAK